ncbi:MAG: hypothetical protein HPM95_19950 [Alphaproteobacteria bacterium]|nr:hypothetical protein [Alphaproteobacteria bacterium]
MNGVERLRDGKHQGAAIVGSGGKAECLDAGEGLHESTSLDLDCVLLSVDLR